ncbi:hypothetical protein BCR44DRAFT_29192 [Catenaria anguillulae PL171]|uniref:Secreted protein n=1 Tax=Catenaria anguillulae PL171 TaxID=765915 RepID=A0A1Y2HZ30_9FUNG|nr:hypothetical protein BCR44DRAFT_29192 [Catenaria anguillulae PL171]
MCCLPITFLVLVLNGSAGRSLLAAMATSVVARRAGRPSSQSQYRAPSAGKGRGGRSACPIWTRPGNLALNASRANDLANGQSTFSSPLQPSRPGDHVQRENANRLAVALVVKLSSYQGWRAPLVDPGLEEPCSAKEHVQLSCRAHPKTRRSNEVSWIGMK